MRPFWIIAAGVAAIGITGYLAMREPRGIRNNNPLNIEQGANWNGLADVQTDARFCVFKDVRYGYRAAARIIDNYKNRGVETLAQIISTWAPASENNTAAYIDSVSQKIGVGADSVVTKEFYPALFAAMTIHENGENPYSLETIAEGVSWA